MNKVITIIMSVIAIVAIIGGMIFFQKLVDTKESKTQELTNKQNDGKKLIKSIDKLETQKEDLEKNKEQNKREVDVTKGKLAKAEERLKDKKTQLKDQNDAYEDFSKTRVSKESELARFEKEFSDLKIKINDSSLSLSNIANKVQSMEVEVDEVDEKIDANDEALEGLETVKEELETKRLKLVRDKNKIIESFDSTPVMLSLVDFDKNWNIATLSAAETGKLSIGDTVIVDLGVYEKTQAKRSFILKINAINGKEVSAQFITEDPKLIEALAIGQKALYIKA